MPRPLAHEHGDVKVKWVALTLAILTGTAVFLHIALAGLQWAFMRFGGTEGQLPSQPAPPAHLYQRQESEAILRAGAERLAHPARMPLDRAIDEVVRRGWQPPAPAGRKGGRP